jgi:hypothetical protein
MPCGLSETGFRKLWWTPRSPRELRHGRIDHLNQHRTAAITKRQCFPSSVHPARTPAADACHFSQKLFPIAWFTTDPLGGLPARGPAGLSVRHRLGLCAPTGFSMWQRPTLLAFRPRLRPTARDPAHKRSSLSTTTSRCTRTSPRQIRTSVGGRSPILGRIRPHQPRLGRSLRSPITPMPTTPSAY